MYNGNKNIIDCKEVKMESGCKLGNNEKVKFVGSGKVWDGERKLVGLMIHEEVISFASFISQIKLKWFYN